MAIQTKESLRTFLQQLTDAHAGPKDSEADGLIQAAYARQPDAAYLLVQLATQLERELEAAQAELQKLQSEIGPARLTPRSGFQPDQNAWGSQRSAGIPQSAPDQRPVETAVPALGAAAPRSSWGASILGNVATTAAGVVAGSFLFQGIQGLSRSGTPSQASSDSPPAPQPKTDEVASNYDQPPSDSETDSFAADTDDSGDVA